jgi:hypothetical protein
MSDLREIANDAENDCSCAIWDYAYALRAAADRIEALEAENARLREADVNALVEFAAMARAMNALLDAPKGVVPDVALPWYHGRNGRFYALQITGSKAEWPKP